MVLGRSGSKEWCESSLRQSYNLGGSRWHRLGDLFWPTSLRRIPSWNPSLEDVGRLLCVDFQREIRVSEMLTSRSARMRFTFERDQSATAHLLLPQLLSIQSHYHILIYAKRIGYDKVSGLFNTF